MSAEAADFAAEFQGTEYFKPLILTDIFAAREKMMLHEIDAIIVIKQDFVRKLNTYFEAAIQVIVDGVDSNNARIAEGYIEGAW